eukprot:7307697-Karenia_brevis.AAC.1
MEKPFFHHFRRMGQHSGNGKKMVPEMVKKWSGNAKKMVPEIVKRIAGNGKKMVAAAKAAAAAAAG